MRRRDAKWTKRTPGEEQSAPHPVALDEPALRRRWSTAFLIAGSALFGATAIALWNRRTLAHMRAEFHAMRQTRPRTAAEIAEDEVV